MGKSEEMKRFAGRRAGSCEALVAAQRYVNEGGGGWGDEGPACVAENTRVLERRV